MLSEIEKESLTIVAVLRRTEGYNFDCRNCSEEMQEQRNCGGAYNTPPFAVFKHDLVGEYYSCPINNIPTAVIDFLDEYDYYEKYPAKAPSYLSVLPRFWDAVKFLDARLSEVEDINIKNMRNNHKAEEDSLKKMRAMFSK